MTPPKEKAKELVDKFTLITTGGFDLAKESTLICVDEMIEQNGEIYLNSLGEKAIAYYKKVNSYLFEVKYEIQKL